MPHLLQQSLPPDIVLVHTSLPLDGTVSLGTEVNILPAAIEAVLALDEIDYGIEVAAPLASPGVA